VIDPPSLDTGTPDSPPIRLFVEYRSRMHLIRSQSPQRPVQLVVVVLDSFHDCGCQMREIRNRSSEQIPVLQDLIHRLDERIGEGHIHSGDALLERNRLKKYFDRAVVIHRSSFDDELDLRQERVPEGERTKGPDDPQPPPKRASSGSCPRGGMSSDSLSVRGAAKVLYLYNEVHDVSVTTTGGRRSTAR